MWFVSYKFSNNDIWQEQEFKTEREAMDEALQFLAQGYIVQVYEEA